MIHSYFLLLAVLIYLSNSEHSIPYSDQLARHKLIYAAIASYATIPQDCMDRAFNDSQVKRQITVPCDTVDPNDTCSGFTGVSHEDKAVLVVFRGTASDEQLVVEGVETVFANHITGHSLGGALASLAASYIEFSKLVPTENLLLVTFGQPRTGDLNYTRSVDSSVENAYRVTHSQDPVPHVPGKGHHGYYHHKSEVYYNEKMTGWNICEEDEGHQCSNANAVDLNFQDHLHYFNLDILPLGYSNCQ
ncbi:hypothetical protein CAEBREN_02276 [Caenorhabditis brenneri]|uniref:Fungal lipase-type domain-containing protein n=1 Tax=Caenorhabditis brenneri TaxID=135651 RepID=G0PGM8_CAEBE|nr:hypothetical protein CAEBREN_02276 [Caenorhabditis brenneri]